MNITTISFVFVFVKVLQTLGAPHVESFNYMLDEGLQDCVKNICPIEFEIIGGERIRLHIENITITPPQAPASCITVKNKKIYPSECRQRAGTYTGPCTVTVGWSVNGVPRAPIDKSMGEVPIMLRVSFILFTNNPVFVYNILILSHSYFIFTSQMHVI